MADLLDRQWQNQLQDYITAAACQGNQWAIASAAGEVALEIAGNLHTYLPTHPQGLSIDRLEFSPDGHWLGAGGREQLHLWQDGLPQPAPHPQEHWVEHLAWHPHRPLLALGWGRQVLLWDAPRHQLEAEIALANSPFDLAWQPQGNFLAVAGYRGLKVYAAADLQDCQLLGVETAAHLVAWSPQGDFLAAATLDRLLVVATITDLDQPWVMGGFPGKIQALSWLGGNSLLAVLSGGQWLYWGYDGTGWQALAAPERSSPLVAIAAHPQLPLVAWVDNRGQLGLQDLDFELLAQQDTGLDPCSLHWHPQGQGLLVGDRQGLVAYWALAD
jgi:hypothetical protein